MKTVYLVRHGESEGNIQRLVGGKDFVLTDNGIEQARILADRFAGVPLDRIVSSDFIRAEQTAAEIASRHNVETSSFSFLGEKMDPTSFFGLPDDDPAVLDYIKRGNEQIADPDYQFEDGENFFTTQGRVTEARTFLENTEYQSLLAVSHGFFLSYFTASILMDATTPSAEVLALTLKLKLGNTGIIKFEVDGSHWRLVHWNDLAHFA